MDLLGSILGNMAKPPAMSEKEKERRKKQREMEKKMEEQQKKATQVCREKAEKKISEFVKDEEATKLELPPVTDGQYLLRLHNNNVSWTHRIILRR